MLKTFIIKQEGKNSDRLVESVKSEIRKYIKREKRKKLPEKAKTWHFDCRFGRDREDLKVIDFIDITENINSFALSDNSEFLIEILAKPFFGDSEK